MRQKTRVLNPAAETLLILNGGRKMTRKKVNSKRTSAKRTSNARRSTALATRGAGGVPNSRRRRRRNPDAKGLVVNALYAAVGAMGTSVLAGFIPFRAAGPAGIAIKFGVAYGFGYIAQRFVSPATAQMMAIGGAASAAGDLIGYVLGQGKGLVTGGFSSPQTPGDETAQMQGLAGYPVGMGDIVEVPDEIARTALNGGFEGYQGMGDVVTTPGFYPVQ